MSDDDQDHLKVLSFNCWGLAVVAKSRKSRLKAIAQALTETEYDVITLQEVWVQKDYDHIVEQIKETLPFTKYFYSGALGSGLAILSKYPIISTAYHRYTLNGKPLKFLHGDYYVGKGCGTALVNHPQLGLLEVFNTHLHAGYGPKDQYKAHRATECWQLANLLRCSAAMGRHIIMSGDFNSVPCSFNYRLIRDHGFMCDSWLQLHGEPDVNKFDMDNMTPDSYTQFFGYTCNSPFNTFFRYYDPNNSVSNARKSLGKRLDYIFYRHTPQLSCIESKVVLTEKISGTQMSYSDHFGVVSVFKVSPGNSDWSEGMAPTPTQIAHPSYTHLQPTTVEDILNVLKLDQIKAKREADWLLNGFLICVLIQVILYIVVVALPTKLPNNLVIILVTVFGGFVMNAVSILIPVCLIVGFVFGSTEQRALLQFINEIETFQQDSKIASNNDCSISIIPNTLQQQQWTAE